MILCIDFSQKSFDQAARMREPPTRERTYHRVDSKRLGIKGTPFSDGNLSSAQRDET